MKYKILSFCGGGIRGLIIGELLTRLYQHDPNIIENTDLFAGTSTGSDIISMILAGMTPESIVTAYKTTVRDSFLNPGTDPNQPAYNIDHLVAGVRLMHPENDPLSSFDKKFVMTSFNVGKNGQPWVPLLLSNLDKSTTRETPIVDAVVSSSVMGGMFGSYKGNVDGAFVHHDPTLVAVSMAVNEGIDPNDIVVICIGTGFMSQWINSDTSKWGPNQWINSQDENTPTLLTNQQSKSPILNMLLNGTSVNLIPDLSAMLLPDRYAYLNPALEYYIPETETNIEKLDYMQSQAANLDITVATNLIDSYWGD